MLAQAHAGSLFLYFFSMQVQQQERAAGVDPTQPFHFKLQVPTRVFSASGLLLSSGRMSRPASCSRIIFPCRIASCSPVASPLSGFLLADRRMRGLVPART